MHGPPVSGVDALEVRRTFAFPCPDPSQRPVDQWSINLSIGGGSSWYFRIVASPL
ncbi:MAG: hypothetical protein ACXVDF_03600 [Ktedonobacterales bacterium]